MKKTTILLVFCLILVTAVCAATSDRFAKYGNIFKTGEYTFQGTSYDLDSTGNKTGSTGTITIAEHAGWYYVDAEEEGNRLRVVVMDDKVYMVSDSEKTVMFMEFDGMDDLGTMEMPDSIDVVSSGTGDLDGKSCYYEKAYDVEDTLVTYWYTGNELYAIQSDETILYITSISQKVDASLFDIPADYLFYDMDELSSLFDDSDDWDWDYDYDYDYDYDDWDWYYDYDYDYDYSDYDWESLLSDIDWSGNWGLYDTPHYYALGILLGLNSNEAQEFEDTMNAIEDFDWDNLNDYYDAENDMYNLDGNQLEDILYMDSSDIDLMRKLAERFKK